MDISSVLVVRSGAVAQLGEHLLCKQGVVGSIPISSTIFFESVSYEQYERLAQKCAAGIEQSRYVIAQENSFDTD